jgi:hypothetical protein
MIAATITWKAFLHLVVSHCDIEGEPKNAFMLKFGSCDPWLNPNGAKPVMLKRGDEDYDNHVKHMITAYKKLSNGIGIQFQTAQKAKETLAWLLEEYTNPSCISWRQENSEIHAKQLDTFLRDLNYLEQRQKVQRAIEGTEIRKVFLVQATGTFSQRWLVKRLSLEVSNHTLAKGVSIPAKSKWNRDLSHFWISLSQYTDLAETPEEIIQSFCNRCQTQPLIMAIHGIQDIETQTLQTLLSEFWEKLLQKLSEQWWCSDHCDCILFLTTNSGTQHNINADYGVNLEPWEFVTVRDMKQWLKPEAVKQYLARCSGEDIEEAYLDLVPREKALSHHLGSPEAILTKICMTFDLNSITELELYWKIAS